MWIMRMLTLRGPFTELDSQIVKFRSLKNEMEGINRAYYGEYLSQILFGHADP